MLKWFKCPDGETIETSSCMEHCRMEIRCLTKPTLGMIAKERVWLGEPSVTQCLNGTMYEYLKIQHDYAIAPMSRAFALLGTIHHKNLEDYAAELGIPSEISLTGDDRNIFDLLEVEYVDKLPIYTMTDYKTWGSFKVAKALGIKVVRTEPKVVGGKTKTTKVFEEISEEGDNWELTMQMNRYRYMLVDKFGITPQHMQVQITVRDGGLQVATMRGVDQLMYLRSVAVMPEVKVKEFFQGKRDTLLSFLEHKNPDIMTVCDYKESWDGKKCEKYCEVAEFCSQGRVVLGIEPRNTSYRDASPFPPRWVQDSWHTITTTNAPSGFTYERG